MEVASDECKSIFNRSAKIFAEQLAEIVERHRLLGSHLLMGTCKVIPAELPGYKDVYMIGMPYARFPKALSKDRDYILIYCEELDDNSSAILGLGFYHSDHPSNDPANESNQTFAESMSEPTAFAIFSMNSENSAPLSCNGALYIPAHTMNVLEDSFDTEAGALNAMEWARWVIAHAKARPLSYPKPIMKPCLVLA